MDAKPHGSLKKWLLVIFFLAAEEENGAIYYISHTYSVFYSQVGYFEDAMMQNSFHH